MKKAKHPPKNIKELRRRNTKRSCTQTNKRTLISKNWYRKRIKLCYEKIREDKAYINTILSGSFLGKMLDAIYPTWRIVDHMQPIDRIHLYHESRNAGDDPEQLLKDALIRVTKHQAMDISL